MTGERRRLVALAAALAPARARALLGRLGDAEGAAASSLADALGAAPRRVRLTALAVALAEAPSAGRGSGAAAHPLLARLELEAARPGTGPAAASPRGPLVRGPAGDGPRPGSDPP